MNGWVIAVWSKKSGMGLPHSTTLSRIRVCRSFRQVVERGSPMPLYPSFVGRLHFCFGSAGASVVGYYEVNGRRLLFRP